MAIADIERDGIRRAIIVASLLPLVVFAGLAGAAIGAVETLQQLFRELPGAWREHTHRSRRSP